MPRGSLICLEGLDRTGKTTQTTLLLTRLTSASLRPTLQKFPDRTTPTGLILHNFLTSTTAHEPHSIHLLFAANRWECIPAILAALERGETVVMDRYLYSGIAFSVGAKGLDYEWCKGAERGLPRPDKTVYLKLGQEAQEGRGGWGGERYEERGVQERTRGVFERLREEEGDWVVVDAGGTVEEVAGEVWRAVEEGVRWAAENELRRF